MLLVTLQLTMFTQHQLVSWSPEPCEATRLACGRENCYIGLNQWYPYLENTVNISICTCSTNPKHDKWRRHARTPKQQILHLHEQTNRWNLEAPRPCQLLPLNRQQLGNRMILPSRAMEKMMLSICELEITSVLCSSAFVVVVKWNTADPQILLLG